MIGRFAITIVMLLSVSACISVLDEQWFNGKALEAYTFPNNEIDASLIEVVELEGSAIENEEAPTLFGVWAHQCEGGNCQNGENPKMPILYFHGNANHIDTYWDRIQILHRLGHPVFAIDYRGYGRSSGVPSEAGIYADGEDAFEHFKERIGDLRFLTYGFSLGSAVAIEVSLDHPPAGLALEAPFASAQAFGDQTFGFGIHRSTLMTTEFDNLEKIKRIVVPKWIAHGEDDDFVAFQFGELLFENAVEPKSFLAVEGGQHSSVPCPDRDTSMSHEDDPCFATAEYIASFSSFVEDL